jgi:hypothetical protein
MSYADPKESALFIAGSLSKACRSGSNLFFKTEKQVKFLEKFSFNAIQFVVGEW